MELKVTLTGKPVSTNSLYQYTCRGGFVHGYMSKEGKATKEMYAYLFKLARPKGWSPRMTYHVDVKLFFESRRKHDIDNYSKILLDAGMDGLVWVDDNQIASLHISKAIDKANPRIEVVVHRV